MLARFVKQASVRRYARDPAQAQQLRELMQILTRYYFMGNHLDHAVGRKPAPGGYAVERPGLIHQTGHDLLHGSQDDAALYALVDLLQDAEPEALRHAGYLKRNAERIRGVLLGREGHYGKHTDYRFDDPAEQVSWMMRLGATPSGMLFPHALHDAAYSFRRLPDVMYPHDPARDNLHAIASQLEALRQPVEDEGTLGQALQIADLVNDASLNMRTNKSNLTTDSRRFSQAQQDGSRLAVGVQKILNSMAFGGPSQ